MRAGYRRDAEIGRKLPDAPVVAVKKNSGDPHYGPSSTKSAPIREGDFVLLDSSGNALRQFVNNIVRETKVELQVGTLGSDAVTHTIDF